MAAACSHLLAKDPSPVEKLKDSDLALAWQAERNPPLKLSSRDAAFASEDEPAIAVPPPPRDAALASDSAAATHSVTLGPRPLPFLMLSTQEAALAWAALLAEATAGGQTCMLAGELKVAL
jgi:hypothetical protein